MDGADRSERHELELLDHMRGALLQFEQRRRRERGMLAEGGAQDVLHLARVPDGLDDLGGRAAAARQQFCVVKRRGG